MHWRLPARGPLLAGIDASAMRAVVPGFSLHDELLYIQ